ncbi:hypothetical protein MNBD_PLANCTO03-890 [hydrothermal vent metagenome]|uniref:Soluble ligand binding domain-containing protein n=1 Tax=hydrothermal vent metagenome TaxID=652676 RepID=A0A3B1E4D4_9ZZZZ
MGPTAANPTNRALTRPSLRSLALSAAAGLGCLLTGCSTDLDHYLDPSEVGRYEATATSVPILDRIAAIEGPADQYIEHDSIRIDDLRPEASEYRVAAGDSLEVRIWDIIQPGMVEIYPLIVDTRGIITIPQLGEISVIGQTAEQTRETIANVTASLVNNPLVQVTVAQSRKQTFTILGGVAGPGTYFIPSADYRLLEGITAAGGIAETIPYLYVIRQIPLEAQPTNTGATGATGNSQNDTQDGEQFLDLLDDLTGEGGGGSPGVMASNSWQPEQPAIDLVEGNAPVEMHTAAPQNTSAWIFVNGEWVRAARADTGLGENLQPDAIVTQRIIKVPTKPLLAGDARYNIVLRASDIIRVPPNEQGFVYIGGEVTRPGSYNLPATGPYTLRRALISAGDLAPTGIPERCDLTRMVGENRQATIMLNYRAIVEGTQPDVVLKPNDIITVGTTFWAYPLAVFRNGFRATYGFGFLMDRNFGNDVFGAPPTNYNR